MQASFDFGLIGLGVMGRNFLLNAAGNGFSVFGMDLNAEKVSILLQEAAKAHKLKGTTHPEDLVRALSKPRKIMMLVPAGSAVDNVIDTLLPWLEPGDILIDGGNSHFRDTDRRETMLAAQGIHFLGVGISGGAHGARTGASIMPGGNPEAYAKIRPLFESVAANFEGHPCVAYLGQKASGHYVKMVHNGIEYGLMQLISESYGILKVLGGLTNQALHTLYLQWNATALKSYLIEITASIFAKSDPLGPGALIDRILDRAKQKGTGKWTSQNAMDLGIAVPTIDAAVRMREVSAQRELRLEGKEIFGYPEAGQVPAELSAMLWSSLYFGFIVTYAQGFHLLKQASAENSYQLDLSAIAKIWRSGCIIRAALLEDINKTFAANPDVNHLLFAPVFITKIKESLPHTREVVQLAAKYGIPMPALSQSLAYFDALTSSALPVNLIQAQRDYFGSHTYERTDREGNFHTSW